MGAAIACQARTSSLDIHAHSTLASPRYSYDTPTGASAQRGCRSPPSSHDPSAGWHAHGRGEYEEEDPKGRGEDGNGWAGTRHAIGRPPRRPLPEDNCWGSCCAGRPGFGCEVLEARFPETRPVDPVPNLAISVASTARQRCGVGGLGGFFLPVRPGGCRRCVPIFLRPCHTRHATWRVGGPRAASPNAAYLCLTARPAASSATNSAWQRGTRKGWAAAGKEGRNPPPSSSSSSSSSSSPSMAAVIAGEGESDSMER